MHNFEVIYQRDTTIINLYSPLKWIADTAHYNNTSDSVVFVDVQPFHYYLDESEKEKFRFIFIKNGLPDIEVKKYIRVNLKDSYLIFKKGLLYYRVH